MRRFGVFFALLALIIALQACTNRGDRSDTGVDTSGLDSNDISQQEALMGEDTGWQPLRRVRGEALSEGELAQLFARLPELGETETDQVEFLRRAESLPVPRTGDSVSAKWPPDLSVTVPGRSPEGPLQVQAFRPEGEVELPFQLALAFDRPMVALGAVTDRPVPKISISPEVPGRWRWIGTQTLTFQPARGYPRATEFTVEVAAGAKAVDGTTLTAPHSFSFATAPPRVMAIYPHHGPHSTDQPILLVFDQPMHGDTESKVVVEQKGRRIPMRVLPASDMEKHFPAYKELVEEGRAFLLAPRVDYEGEASVSVRVETPFRSLEGPRLGTETMSQTIQIRGPLKMVNLRCGWQDPCPPGQPIMVEFTNPLDEELNLDASEIQISPAVADLRVSSIGNYITIQGDFQPRTRYEVTLPARIKDSFGQSLEGNRSGFVQVGPHPSLVAGPNLPMVVRPADGSLSLPFAFAEIESIRVRLHRVEPSDWAAFSALHRHYWGAPENIPFDITHEETLRFSREERQERRELELDLRPALGGADRGHVVVILNEARGHHQRNQRWIFWVQITDLAADVSDDGRELAVRVTRLSDGAPVQGATLAGDSNRATTDTNGEGRIRAQGEAHLVVESGSDRLIIPAGGSLYGHSHWSTVQDSNKLLWSVIDDRQMYKPGETATFHGWIRSIGNRPTSDLEASEARQVSYTLVDRRRNEIARGTAAIDSFGGFEIKAEIPDGANTGQAHLRLEARDRGGSFHYHHGFQIQEFRRPEYEVKLGSDAGPHVALQSLRWEAEAAYYAGGALAAAPATWRFNESKSSYSPPGWSQYQFGSWSPWWIRHHHFHGGRGFGGGHDFEVLPEEFRQGLSERQTDGSGRDIVVASLLEATRGLPRSITATVSIQDVNRQAWEASNTVLVHPAKAYVGLRTETTFIQRDETFHLDVIAVDIDGAVATNLPVEVEIFRNRGWNEPDSDATDSCSTTSGAEAHRCSFANLLPGSYTARAAVKDAQGRTAQSEMTFWVAGQDRQGAQVAEEGELMLIPDGEEYAVGATAKLFVQSPTYPLEAVIELRRDGRFERRLQRITAEAPIVEVALTEEMLPNVHVSVVAVSAGENYNTGSFLSGSINLPVSTATRRLNVEIEPSASAVTPGAEIGVQVSVTDHQGRGVSDARVLLFAVDEALLALSSYTLRDVLASFYPERAPATQDARSRSWLILDQNEESTDDDEDQLRTIDREEREDNYGNRGLGGSGAAPPAGRRGRAEAPMMAMESAQGGVEGTAAPAIQVREIFDALAIFRSDLVTDANGVVQVNEKLPESLTRYRIMAVAVEGVRHFGTGESTITARMPLMVRPSPPRFLNVGDEFEFPLVLQNQTAEELVVDVALRSSSTLEILETPGMRVRVPAADRVEVRFPARAISAGQARIQAVATSGALADAAFSTLPVLTPATTEAFATYGSISEEDVILQALQVPQEVYSQFGGLDIQTSSTQLQALTDALIYLVSYPFYCSEQLASRIISVLALYDVLDAFNAPDLPSPNELRAQLHEWTTQLIRNQRSDGGFGFWINSQESWPFVSAHATFALWQAREAGIDVPVSAFSRAQGYLLRMNHWSARFEAPRQKATVESYALYVLHRIGTPSGSELDQIITRHGIETFSMEALGWLLPLAQGTQWEERIVQRIQNQVQETSATAEFQESYDSGAFQLLHTSRRTDGVVLDGLLQTNPDHYLVEKVVRGLLAHRSRGRWGNTQENVFILMALKRYFDEYEADTPDFIARAWLGDLQIGEHEFRGRSTERYEMHVPMSFLHEGDTELPLVMQRDGQGRMYYRMGVRYAPKSRQMPAIDEGFVIVRTYHAVDNEDDVRHTDEGWVIRAGARVRVELTMTVPARRYHVALVDWLPAGFEPINTALATSQVESGLAGGSSARSQRWWWWGGRWFEHENLRDERVEAFASLIHQGVYTYSHVVRATTPGDFVAMPAKAEEMYHPETFGRSSTERVRIVE